MSQAQILLLVEDEQVIQALLQESLTEAGYEVVISQDGATAMRELEADHTRFRGIITDVKLGKGPDGWEIGHRARELAPAIPVIYMSGDSASDWSSKGVPNSLMISKPFAVAQMVTAISTQLTESDRLLASAGISPGGNQD